MRGREYNMPLSYPLSLLTHRNTLSLPFLFCSLPFIATVFSHSFPNLSNNLRSCVYLGTRLMVTLSVC